MVKYILGDLFKSEAEVYTCTVNTVGVMGCGIAFEFKRRYPNNYLDYRSYCKSGRLQTGNIFVTETRKRHGPRWIVNFPTKRHWRNPSELDWIRDGLWSLRKWLDDYRVESIALPKLGCSNGGLDWYDVRDLIESILGPIETDCLVYLTRQY